MINARPHADLIARLASSETTRIALAAQLETARRALWQERALRRFPAIEGAVDLIPHVQNEMDYMALAAKLSGYARGARDAARS